MTPIRWSSRFSFVFAASAAAIGLGNIWRFPFMLGQNGGGAFVLIYLAAVIILGIPLLVAEVVLGRTGRSNPVTSLINVARQSKQSRHWGMLGGLTILAAFLILTYYVVIVGWVLDYLVRALTGQFTHVTEAASVKDFIAMKSSHWEMLVTDSMVVIGAMGIIILGIKKGLERAVLIMFPALFILMLILLGYAMTTGGFTQALEFLFKPDMSEVTSKTFLLALGQAFFSLNIAMGVTIMFSAYLPEKTPIASSAIAIAIADTVIALLAGLIIFPIVFANNLEPNAGPSLIFQTLPIAFGQLPLATLTASLFFLLLFFAAFSSVIALLEPAVSWLIDNHNFSRTKAVITAGSTCWLLSLLTIGSFSHPHYFSIHSISWFKAIDFLTAGIMLPLGGLLIAMFTGWLMAKNIVYDQLGWIGEGLWFKTWRFILRYFAPLAIICILLMSLGLI